MTPDDPLDTVQLHAYLDRMRKGDREAADELLRRVGGRLERLARRMLKGFPNVKRWSDTGDVLQSAVMRLLRTLEAISPGTTREFANLAALHIRRELLDLARRFRGRLGPAAAAPRGEGEADPVAAAPARESGSDDLDRWAAFHEEVEGLPAGEREVVGLRFYHGWTEKEIAELFQVDERTVRRRWRAASLKLTEALGGRLPES
jgi:RNA polymerase sigma-70 factor (ECF subfamily)